MIRFGIILAALFSIAACSKKENSAADRLAPVISSLSPANNQVFSAGQIVNISAGITDDTRIATVHVHISDNTTGQLLVDIHRYPDAANYNLAENFTAQAGIKYKIQLVAIDVAANESYTNLFVSVN